MAGDGSDASPENLKKMEAAGEAVKKLKE